ncbi:MAG: MBL fold metallo-hydrolase [Planctomycetes bacterium]|nr:MBL fold metallo-hydrolase [Planctomycetota bacterium]
MNVATLIVGPIQACCYVVNFPPDSEALVIDPGGDGEEIVNYLKKKKLKPVYLVNTHGHIDHIGANAELKKAFPDALLCIHPSDSAMLGASHKNLSTELGFSYTSPEPDKLLEGNDSLKIGKHEFKILHTPGHTLGGISLLHQPSGIKAVPTIFTGDTLFQMGVGRTDFPGGSMQELIRNIKEKILSLPDDTVVYPGHGPATTVGAEKHGNPFL